MLMVTPSYEAACHVPRNVSRRYAGFWLASCFLMAFVLCSPAVAAELGLPNVVFILADDLGIGDVKCFGRERCQIETPAFDRLAREGMMFTDAHATASVCVPTRMAIMTGRYPWRFQAPRPSGPWGFLNPRIAPTVHNLGSLMQSAGYRTGYVGKWHLGTLMQTDDGKNQGPKNVDYTKPLEMGPGNYGFDFSYVLPGSLDMYPYVFVRNNEFLGPVTARRGWSAFNRVGPAAEGFEDYQVLDSFSAEAEKFITASASAAGTPPQPFFLYLALTAPHTPVSPSPAFQGRSQLGLYGDFVIETDNCVQRVLRALDSHGLANNTLVIATSDHGAALYAGNIRQATHGQLKELEKVGHYSSGIYRGYKFSAYEGGLRVPFVARWPGLVRPGSTCDRLVGLNDLMRTLSEITGQELPGEAGPDSISFLPLLKDAAAAATRSSLVMRSTSAFVVRENNWKLALCPGSGCVGRYGNVPAQADAWRAALAQFGRSPRNADELKNAPFVQLFDLAADAGEASNLAAERPDTVRRLIALLDRQIANGRSTAGPPLNNDKQHVNYFSGVPRFVWKN